MQRPRLAQPYTELEPRYDVVIIGSGYGGGIAAARLAGGHRSVCVLERGREILATDFPETLLEARRDFQVRGRVRGRKIRHGSPLGLYDLRVSDELNTLLGCGLGGTSLINAGVFMPADEHVFDDPQWPEEIRADRDGLRRGRGAAERMLRPSAYPRAAEPLRKLRVLEKVHQEIGGELVLPPLLTNFGTDPVNAAGVDQKPCNGCGNCISGCRYEAKNTVDRTYLVEARARGAQIFTEIAVDHIEKLGGRGYAVHYGRQSRPIERDLPLSFVLADCVVVAAGCLGSTEILLRSREHGLRLSDTLGSSFSANGNMMAVAYDPTPEASIVGRRTPHPSSVEPGPCIVGAIDMRRESGASRGLVIEDGTIPAVLDALVSTFQIGAHVRRADSKESTLGKVGNWVREIAAAAAEQMVGARRNAQLFLVQAHDDSRGRLSLGADGVRIDWPDFASSIDLTRMEDLLRRAAGSLGASYKRLGNPLLLGGDFTTVHPLGGCPMGVDRFHGVVDHACRVYDARSDDPRAVHEGLYVCDGSIIPRSIGNNPIATISTLAERACALMATDVSESLQKPTRAQPAREREPKPFVLSEAFSGWITDDFAHDPLSPNEQGRFDSMSHPIEVRLTITMDDVDAFRRQSNHPAAVTGTVVCERLSPHPMSVSRGKCFLLTDDPERQDVFYNLYNLLVTDRDDRRFFMTGMKVWRDGSPISVWNDGTIMPIELFVGDYRKDAPAFRGLVRMSPSQFAGSVMTYAAGGASGLLRQLQAEAGFYGFSIQRIWERLRWH